MNLLISNDDGIEAQGIRELAKALAEEHDVYIFAPHTQRSASGHGITMKIPVMVKEVEFPYAKRAWEMQGTPVDCVKIGLEILRTQGIAIDMVFAGINHGSNLGTDVLYSGTASVALEGAINHIPSVALSVYEHEPKHFDTACWMAVQACRLVKGKLPADTALNINIPDLPREEIRGVRVTRLGPREYEEWFLPVEAESGEFPAYTYAGSPIRYENLPEDMDVVAAQEGYISVTPLQLDLTAHKLRREVETWGFTV